MKILVSLSLLVFSFSSFSQQTELREVEADVFFAGISGGTLSPEELVGQTKLEAPENYRIESFSLTLLRDGVVIQQKAESGSFTDVMIEQLNKCTPGDKIYFEWIKALDAKGELVQLPVIKFVIGE